MNHALFGTNKSPDDFIRLTEPGFLLIGDGTFADAFEQHFFVSVFDPLQHSFNTLKDTSYLAQCNFVETMLALFPAGQNTLTKEGVPDAFFEELAKKPKSLEDMFKGTSDDPSYLSAQRMVRRLRRSPILTKVLCEPTNFKIAAHRNIVVRLDRAALGRFDALALALFLIGQVKGQVIVPDFGFYGRELHTYLIDQDRLTAGVNYLAEVPPKLQQALLTIKDIQPLQVVFDDADTLAKLAGWKPGDQGYADFVEGAMRG